MNLSLCSEKQQDFAFESQRLGCVVDRAAGLRDRYQPARCSGCDLEQIKFLLRHSSIQTREQYLGSEQDIAIAVNDNLGL